MIGLVVGILSSIMLFYIANDVFNKNQKYSLKILFIQIIYIILYALIYKYAGHLSIFIEMVLAIIYVKLLLPVDIIKITHFIIIIHVIQILLEFLIFALDLTVFHYFQIINFLATHVVINSCITIITTVIIFKIYKNRFKEFFSTTKVYSLKYIISTILVLLLVPTIGIIKNTSIDSLYDVHIATEFILSAILSVILYYLLKQKNKMEQITKQYTEATEYYKMTEGLLEEYRYILHENKNQLLIIKSMIKDNEELEDYLNHLINGRRNLKYEWVCDLKNIPIQGLKGLVNYKIAEMKKKNLNVEIYIDDEIGKLKIKTLNQKEQHELYSIMGIFLDNALEASNLSEEKMVSIQCYKEKEQVHIMIANTYVGEVNLNKIKELGYSSKGKNRGVGIPLVNKIVKNSSIYKNETELFDIFFVQHLYIQLPNNTKN